MATEHRVEMVRDGKRMGLWYGELRLAVVDPGLPAQQLARYIEMQLRAGFAAEAIQSMLRGESKATTGSVAPARKRAGPSKASSGQPAAEAADPKATDVDEAAIEAILEGTVGDVRKALESGAHDEHLDEVRRLEKAGKDRKGVHKAIASRSDS